MTSTGKFRVYPSHRGAKLPWCIHNGSIEIAVSEVQIVGLVRTTSLPSGPVEGPDAWIEVEGKLLIIGSAATISAPTE